MSEDLELVRGSGNVYHDAGLPDANVRQTKAIFAAQIIRILDERSLSTREAQRQTDIGHSEFSRIRNANLSRFTIDRLITIMGRLDDALEVRVVVEPWQKPVMA